VVTRTAALLRGGVDDDEPESDIEEPFVPEDELEEPLDEYEELLEARPEAPRRTPAQQAKRIEWITHWRAEREAGGVLPPAAPPTLDWWCRSPSPVPEGKRIPRRRRTEVMLAAAAHAEALPNRDYRPRPPTAAEPAEEEEDLSEDAIFQKLRMTFTRPDGIDGPRWYEMLISFARRKAAEAAEERGHEADEDPQL
jgi:hypothetical protein